MNQQEAIDFVVGELSKYGRREEIILALCRQTGADWEQVEAFVCHIEHQHRRQIAVRSSPIVIVVGAGTIIASLCATAYITILTLTGAMFPLYSIPYLGNLFYLVLGLAMMAGGITGIWKTIRSLF